jgi:hypothetical protein
MTRRLFFLGLTLVVIRSIGPLGNGGAQNNVPLPGFEWVVGKTPAEGWSVGDLIPLSLRITHPVEVEINLPRLPDHWGPFEVREQSQLLPERNRAGQMVTTLETKLTLWAPGEYETPSLVVQHRIDEGEWEQITVPTISITVVSLLEEGDLAKRDLKPQTSLPSPPLWPWLAGGVLFLAAMGTAGWLWWCHWRAAGRDLGPGAALTRAATLEEAATAELCRIRKLDLPNTGDIPRQYSLIAACLRRYVSERFDIPALDQTTNEIVTALEEKHWPRRYIQPVQELLSEADLVKFARLRPTAPQARASLKRAGQLFDLVKAEETGEADLQRHATAQRVESDDRPRSP